MRWLTILREDLRQHRISYLIAVTVTALGLVGYVYVYMIFREPSSVLAKFIDNLELKSFDLRFYARGQTPPAPEIVIVAIDQETLWRVGAYPFSRENWVSFLDHMNADGAKVVGFDISFLKPDDKSAVEDIKALRAEYESRVASGRASADFLQVIETRQEDADTDRRFTEAIRNAGNVVLGYHFEVDKDDSGYLDYVDTAEQESIDDDLAFAAYTTIGARDAAGEEPPPLDETFTGEAGFFASPPLMRFTQAADFSVGYFNTFVDADSIVRRFPLAMQYSSAWQGEGGEVNYFPSLDIQILRRFLDVPEHEMNLVYNKAGVEAVQLGDRKIPTDLEGDLLVHYQGGPKTYPHYSLGAVLAGEVPPGTFTDKLVLVGPTALVINDFHPSPFAERAHAGIEIHANLLDTMLNQRFIRHGIREQLIDLGILLLFGLVAGFILARVPPSWTTPFTFISLAVFMVFAYLMLTHYQAWVNVVMPGGVLTANWAIISAFRVLIEDREKRKTRAAFAQYVPAGLVKELMKNPDGLKLGGQERELTIMFSDIRGFTSLSERLSPMELTGFLNSYTDEMTDIIFRHWGTLDKYEGDAIMAFWGAPYDQDDHSLRCCAACLDQGKRMDELRVQWKEEGKPDINIGIGMNTGRVVVGNMGSRKRFNYTVLGDPVNLAARLEGVNKTYATRIIVSEFTYGQAGESFELLASRVSSQFKIPLEELAGSNGAKPVRRARQCGLYVGHEKNLASDRALAKRFGFDDEQEIPALLAEVEKWKERDKKLNKRIHEVGHGLHRFLFRQLDWIRVKGKQQPVGIHELLDYGSAEDHWGELIELFNAGLQAYRARQWEFAIDLLQSALEKYPDDGPSRIIIERCRQFMVNEPAPEWDGVYVMTTK